MCLTRIISIVTDDAARLGDAFERGGPKPQKVRPVAWGEAHHSSGANHSLEWGLMCMQEYRSGNRGE
jgi:hypothetical protein